MSIGVLGGTFDPPHQAHCEISLRAINQYGLKKVLFVPSKNPWQKSVTTSYEDRFNMTNLLTENQSYFEVSDIETINEKQTYTVDTLKNLSIPKNELFFILGADVAIEVRTWSRYEELDSLTNFLIAPRDYIQDELLEKTKINLAKFAIPKYMRIMKEFPKTQTGKIQKNKLREEGITIDTWQNKNI